MDAAVASGAGTGATGGAMSPGGTEERKMMRLHILSGSFVPADDAGGGGCPMDPSVWSKMPEDIMWRVLGFVPAAKRFQLHSVSRKWQRELTSVHFRNRIAAADSSESSRQQKEEEVVACVTPADESRSKLKVVEVDLSFVPDWFWNPNGQGSRSYSVVAAGEGLVCISNHMEFTCNPRKFPPWEQPLPGESWPALYCLLNPLTRTCVVVPPPPFQPLGWLSLSPVAPTIYGWDDRKLQVATFEVAPEPGEGLGTWLHSSALPTQRTPESRQGPVVVQCDGEIFWYHAGRLHVLAPSGSATEAVSKRQRLEEESAGVRRRPLVQAADAVDGPSVALLGLDATTVAYRDAYSDDRVALVAHKGTVFFVAQLMRRLSFTCTRNHAKLLLGVWRLERSRMAWEPVSHLSLQQAKRLFFWNPVPKGERQTRRFQFGRAFSVRDLLCCDVSLSLYECTVVGFNLHAGRWELVHDERDMKYWGRSFTHSVPLVELRPDFFLPPCGW